MCLRCGRVFRPHSKYIRHAFGSLKKCTPRTILKDEAGFFTCSIHGDGYRFSSNRNPIEHLWVSHTPQEVVMSRNPVRHLAVRDRRKLFVDEFDKAEREGPAYFSGQPPPPPKPIKYAKKATKASRIEIAPEATLKVEEMPRKKQKTGEHLKTIDLRQVGESSISYNEMLKMEI